MFQIQNPSGKAGSSSYGGTYLKFNQKGVTEVEALSPGLDRWLRAAGYTITDLSGTPEAERGFDPSAETVADVTKYLAQADTAERERVLNLEKDGQARKGILGWSDGEES